MRILPYELPPLPYVWEVMKLGGVAVGPALVAAGLIFPLLLRDAITAGARRVGVLLAWNGLGGWLGAELCQSRLAPAFGLWTTVTVLAAGYGALFVVVALRQTRSSNRSRMSAVTTALVLTLAASAWFTRELPQTTVNRGERLAAVTVGREGVVATLECGPGDWQMLFNNSYTLGGTKAQFNQERQAHLPLLLHGRARAVACLGVATGGTVGGVALHPEIERIEAIELSPLVLKYAREFFGSYHRQVFADPRVRFFEEDARSIIAARPGAYDVVVGDLFLPWRTGEGRLFVLEHYQNVRRSLKPGGLFCQWLPLFQLTRPQFETIARTFREVFPDAFLVRADFYTEMPILGLVGGRELARVDWPQVAAACARLRADGSITDPLARHVEGVAMMIVGPLPAPPPGPLNTLANAWLEWDAGKNILEMRTPWFIGVPCGEYVREVHRAGQTILPPELRAAHDVGQFFLTLEIAAKLQLPALADLQSQTHDRMPGSLLRDKGADWRQWPMRLKPAGTHIVP